MIVNKKKSKGTSLSRQLVAMIVLGVICLSLVATLIAVNIISAHRKFPYGGDTYYIIRRKDESGKTYYIMTDSDKNPLKTTSDGYFIVKDGTLIELDQTTGLADKYIRPDTEGNEQVGLNDRVLMFPHTDKDAIQSIEVYNSGGSYVFYRMRTYEDTDKTAYALALRSGEYIFVSEDGSEVKRGEDGLYTFKTGNKVSVDARTGVMTTHTYLDFDGREYSVRKTESGKYALFLAGEAVTDVISKIGEKTNSEGKKYEATLYSYLVTVNGTLVSLDEDTGIVGSPGVREYDEKGKYLSTYYFARRDGKYILLDKNGVAISETAIDDAGYYKTANNAYLAFNEENGSYSIRVRKNYYIKANNDGVYQLYKKGNAVQSGGGYYLIEGSTYITLDTSSGSFSTFEYTGDSYKKTDTKSLGGKSIADNGGSFVLEGFESTSYDKSLFAALVSSSGYTITAAGGKLSQPEMINGKINFAAYGLAECERVDESGKTYHYTPAYYILTDTKGNVHKVTVGDKIISGAGYYMKYEGLGADGNFTERQAVYIRLDNYSTGYTLDYNIFYYYSITDTLLASREAMVTPMAVFPMSDTTYFNVKDFTLMVYNPQKSQDSILNDNPEDDEDYYDRFISFSYEDVAERKNTALANIPYVMNKGCLLYGYNINSYSVDACLASIRDMAPLGVKKLGVNDQDLVTYGLDVAPYILYFEYAEAVNNEGGNEQMILISELTPNDTYYIYSQLYDMIVEVRRSDLPFLDWKSTDWLSSDFYEINIGFSDKIKIESGDYWASFDVAIAQTLTANIRTSGSSNFVHTVRVSDDRKSHLLTISAKINANVLGSVGTTGLVSVDFETLENYYEYAKDKNAVKDMTPTQLAKLNAFAENIIQAGEQDGSYIAIHGLSFVDGAGREMAVFTYFIFDADGEITVSVAIDQESPAFVFSKRAYEYYEKVMYSDEDITDAQKKEAFDFYLSQSVSTSATNDFEQIVATNSDGEKTVYTKEKIVKTYKDGRVVTDYALGNDYKVFFDVGKGDLIGIGKSWIRYYDLKSDGTADGYREIKDATYTFEASAVKLILPVGDANTVVADGTLGEGRFTVTVDANSVLVKDENGNETRYWRYTGTTPFSSFYSSLLWASYEGFCDIPEEQKKAFRESDDSECQVKITIDTKIRRQYVFRTYQYSERRAYITSNGEGDFFVLRSFIDKIINTSKIIFDGTDIDPKGKY